MDELLRNKVRAGGYLLTSFNLKSMAAWICAKDLVEYIEFRPNSKWNKNTVECVLHFSRAPTPYYGHLTSTYGGENIEDLLRLQLGFLDRMGV